MLLMAAAESETLVLHILTKACKWNGLDIFNKVKANDRRSFAVWLFVLVLLADTSRVLLLTRSPIFMATAANNASYSKNGDGEADTVCSVAMDACPASPLLDERLLDDLYSVTPRVRLRSSSSSAASPDDFEVEIDEYPNEHRNYDVTHTSTGRTFRSKEEALECLLFPRDGEELQLLDVKMVDEVLPVTDGSGGSGDVDPISPTEALKNNPFLDENESDSGCSILSEESSRLAGENSEVQDLSNSWRREHDEEMSTILKELYSNCIKQELSQKINLSRLRLGKEELRVNEDKIPKIPEPTISYEAIIKRNQLREKNKEYAKLSRQRASVRQLRMEEEYLRLFRQLQVMKRRVSCLRKQRSALRNSVFRHMTCCNLKTQVLETLQTASA